MLTQKSHKKYLTILSALSILLAVTGCEETYKVILSNAEDNHHDTNPCADKNNNDNCTTDTIPDGKCCKNVCIALSGWDQSECKEIDTNKCNGEDNGVECTTKNGNKGKCCNNDCIDETQECGTDENECNGVENNGNSCNNENGWCCNNQCIENKCVECDDNGTTNVYGCTEEQICESGSCKPAPRCQANNENDLCCDDDTCTGTNLICQTWDSTDNEHYNKCIACGGNNEPCCESVESGEVERTCSSGFNNDYLICGLDNKCHQPECNSHEDCKIEHKIICYDQLCITCAQYNNLPDTTKSDLYNTEIDNNYKTNATCICGRHEQNCGNSNNGYCCQNVCYENADEWNGSNTCGCTDNTDNNCDEDKKCIELVSGSTFKHCVVTTCNEDNKTFACSNEGVSGFCCEDSEYTCREITDTTNINMYGPNCQCPNGCAPGLKCLSKDNDSYECLECTESDHCQNDETCDNGRCINQCDNLQTGASCTSKSVKSNGYCCNGTCKNVDNYKTNCICHPNVNELKCDNYYTCVQSTSDQYTCNCDNTSCNNEYNMYCDETSQCKTCDSEEKACGTECCSGDKPKCAQIITDEVTELKCVQCITDEDCNDSKCDTDIGTCIQNTSCDFNIAAEENENCKEDNTAVLTNDNLNVSINSNSDNICIVICGEITDPESFGSNDSFPATQNLTVVGTNNATLKFQKTRTAPLFKIEMKNQLIFKNIKLEFDAEFGYSDEGGDGYRNMRGIIANELKDAVIENVSYKGKITFSTMRNIPTDGFGGFVGKATNGSFKNNTFNFTNTNKEAMITSSEQPLSDIGGFIGHLDVTNSFVATNNSVKGSIIISISDNNITNVGGFIGKLDSNISTNVITFEGNSVNLSNFSVKTTNSAKIDSIGGFIGQSSGLYTLKNSSNFIKNYTISTDSNGGARGATNIAGLIGSVQSSGGTGDVAQGATGAGSSSITLTKVQNIIIKPPTKVASFTPLFPVNVNLDNSSSQVLSYIGGDQSDTYSCQGDAVPTAQPLAILAYKNLKSESSYYIPLCGNESSNKNHACCVAETFNNQTSDPKWAVYKYSDEDIQIPLFKEPDSSNFTQDENICTEKCTQISSGCDDCDETTPVPSGPTEQI